MRILDRVGIDKQDLRHSDKAELTKLGVHLVNLTDLTLECDKCGERWSPQLDSSGKLSFGYWICPARCNGESGRRPIVRGAGG